MKKWPYVLLIIPTAALAVQFKLIFKPLAGINNYFAGYTINGGTPQPTIPLTTTITPDPTHTAVMNAIVDLPPGADVAMQVAGSDGINFGKASNVVAVKVPTLTSTPSTTATVTRTPTATLTSTPTITPVPQVVLLDCKCLCSEATATVTP